MVVVEWGVQERTVIEHRVPQVAGGDSCRAKGLQERIVIEPVAKAGDSYRVGVQVTGGSSCRVGVAGGNS